MSRALKSKDPIEVGNGDHRYRVVADWPQLSEDVNNPRTSRGRLQPCRSSLPV